MGINYYHHGTSSDPVHIGKSSYGWVFLLHIYPDADIYSLKDWTMRFLMGEIRDEYDDAITKSDMITTIRFREKLEPAELSDSKVAVWDESVGLYRPAIENCAYHSRDTWSAVAQEFS